MKNLELLKERYPDNYEEMLKKVDAGYPIQYLIGDVEFINTIIKVNENVLIPRFETEYLVEKTLNYIKEMDLKNPKIIDLGTGSGCIAIALKKNIDCEVDAIDISDAALNLAKENAKFNKVDINFFKKDIHDKLSRKYDVIISNPPYIKENGYVEEKVLKYEPHLALFASDEGIHYYKVILENHLNNLNRPGLIAFEIGDDEEDLLKKSLEDYPQLKYSFENDLAGMVRYLFIFNE